jgi:hypothetical protein
MEFSVRHFISGRIRLHLPSLCRKRKLAEAALTWLQAQARHQKRPPELRLRLPHHRI